MNILDFVTGVTLVIAIYLCGSKPKLGWSLYIVNCVLYTILMYLSHLYTMVFVGLILLGIGVKNLRGALKSE